MGALRELFDARFPGAWLGNAADVERCATTMPERRLRIVGLNGTAIREELLNRVEATSFLAKTNPNQFWSEVKLVAEALPQMSQPVLIDWSSFSSERQGNIQDTQIEWRAAQLRALLDGSLLCRLHRGFSKVLFFLFDCRVGLNTFDPAQLGFYPAPDQEEGSMIRIGLSFSDASTTSWNGLTLGDAQRMEGIYIKAMSQDGQWVILSNLGCDVGDEKWALMRILQSLDPFRTAREQRAVSALRNTAFPPYLIDPADPKRHIRRSLNLLMEGNLPMITKLSSKKFASMNVLGLPMAVPCSLPQRVYEQESSTDMMDGRVSMQRRALVDEGEADKEDGEFHFIVPSEKFTSEERLRYRNLRLQIRKEGANEWLDYTTTVMSQSSRGLLTYLEGLRSRVKAAADAGDDLPTLPIGERKYTLTGNKVTDRICKEFLVTEGRTTSHNHTFAQQIEPHHSNLSRKRGQSSCIFVLI